MDKQDKIGSVFMSESNGSGITLVKNNIIAMIEDPNREVIVNGNLYKHTVVFVFCPSISFYFLSLSLNQEEGLQSIEDLDTAEPVKAIDTNSLVGLYLDKAQIRFDLNFNTLECFKIIKSNEKFDKENSSAINLLLLLTNHYQKRPRISLLFSRNVFERSFFVSDNTITLSLSNSLQVDAFKEVEVEMKEIIQSSKSFSNWEITYKEDFLNSKYQKLCQKQ